MAEIIKIQQTVVTQSINPNQRPFQNIQITTVQETEVRQTEGNVEDNTLHQFQNQVDVEDQEIVAENPITPPEKEDKIVGIELPETQDKQIIEDQNHKPQCEVHTFQERQISVQQEEAFENRHQNHIVYQIVQQDQIHHNHLLQSQPQNPQNHSTNRRMPVWIKVLILVILSSIIGGGIYYAYNKFKNNNKSKKQTNTEISNKDYNMTAEQSVDSVLKTLGSFLVSPENTTNTTIAFTPVTSNQTIKQTILTPNQKTNLTTSIQDSKIDCPNGQIVNNKCLSCPQGQQLIGLDCIPFLQGFKHLTHRYNDLQ